LEIYDAHADEHYDERETNRQQVLAEFWARHDAEFDQTIAGRWAADTVE